MFTKHRIVIHSATAVTLTITVCKKTENTFLQFKTFRNSVENNAKRHFLIDLK